MLSISYKHAQREKTLMFHRLTITSCVFASIAAIASASVTASDLAGAWRCNGESADSTQSIIGILSFDEEGNSANIFDMKVEIPTGIVQIRGDTNGTYEITDTAIVITVETMNIDDVRGEGRIGESLREAKFHEQFVGDLKTSALLDPISNQNIVSYSPEELVIFNPNNEITQTCTR